MLLNHFQLLQSASCHVSHPLMYYQLAVTQAASAAQSLGSFRLSGNYYHSLWLKPKYKQCNEAMAAKCWLRKIPACNLHFFPKVSLYFASVSHYCLNIFIQILS